MNPFKFPLALFAFLGFVAVLPVWYWYLNNFPISPGLSLEERFLLELVLPATIGLFLASWLQPRGR